LMRSGQRGDVECSITREALEAHFWLPAGADRLAYSKCLQTDANALSRSLKGKSGCGPANSSSSMSTIFGSGAERRLICMAAESGKSASADRVRIPVRLASPLYAVLCIGFAMTTIIVHMKVLACCRE
ncbi:hypothetical protein P0D88_50665, partial [Paraburkholderia sp. RL18-103-BIB-C]